MKSERKNKSRKQLDRERDIEREKKKGQLKKLYYAEKKNWKRIGFDSWYQFPTLNEFVTKKLDEWESQQIKIPMGKYQDSEKIESECQQKFVEYLRQLCPQVIEELREFVPLFNNLLGKQKEKYIDIFDRFKDEIFDLDSSLLSKINYSLKNSLLGFRPNKYQDWRFDYTWGEHRLLFQFLYLINNPSESVETEKEILRDTVQIIKDGLVFERGDLTLPDNSGDGILQESIANQSYEVIKDILSTDEKNYFRKAAKEKVIKFLQDIAPVPEKNFIDFIKLQIELLKWSERHNLQKDWLLRYAYYFLNQFSSNPEIKISDLKIEFLNIRSLESYPFEFKFSGWYAGDEDKEDYEKRITSIFELELQRYFQGVSDHLELDKKKRITKPLSHDLIQPLVRKTVERWSFEKIIEIDFKITNSLENKKYFASKLKYLKEELPKFERFDLPYKP